MPRGFEWFEVKRIRLLHLSAVGLGLSSSTSWPTKSNRRKWVNTSYVLSNIDVKPTLVLEDVRES